MPQALAFIAPGVFGVGGSVALFSAAGGLTLAGALVSVGGSLALAQLSQPKIPDAATPQNVQLNSKNSAGPRLKHYGIVKVGGNVIFHRAKNGVSYRVIVHGHGEMAEILEYYLNGEPITLATDAFDVVADSSPLDSWPTLGPFFDGSVFSNDRSYQSGDVVDEQYFKDRPRVSIFSRLGVVPEAHYSQLTDVWPAWTENHRLDGLSSSLIICESVDAEHYRDMYPKGEPDIAVLGKFTKCYDPRIDQKVFTENIVLAINDLAASIDGFNRPDAFDPLDIVEQADISDRDVALVSGGTEKLFRVGGSVLLNETKQDALGRMLQACAGRIRLKPTGKVGLKVGVWIEPEFTLEFDDILEVQEFSSGPDLLDCYNELPARFNSHELGHVEVDAEPWLDEDRVSEDGEILTGPEKTLLMCPSHRQARQVMKIYMERDNPKEEITVLCKPKALPAIYENTIKLNIPEFDFVGDYEVVRHVVNFEKSLLKAVLLSLRKVDSAAFSQSLADQGTVQQIPEPDTSFGVPEPQNVVAAPAGIQVSANTFVAGISVACQAPPSDALSWRLLFSKADQGDWQEVSVGSGSTSFDISGLVDGQAYDVSLAFVTPGGVVGPAVIIEDVVASAVTEPPLPPANLVVSDASGGTALVEMTASSSAGLWKTEIYRDGVLVGVIYASPATEIAFIDNCGAGSFSWTARSVNVSRKNSATDAGPVSAVIA
jgi:hypothetical protein